MNIAKITISGMRAFAVEFKAIPAGVVGATVEFEFTDSRWDNMVKTAVFRGCVTRDVLMDGNTVVVPHEVVAEKGPRLEIGVYGVNSEETVVIPTLWAAAGYIRDSAEPSDDPAADPSLPIWAQLQEQIGDLKNSQGPGGNTGQCGGLSTHAADLLIAILRNGIYGSNQSANITALEAALKSDGSGDNSGDETVTDDITVFDGVVTIVSVGSAVSISDGVLTIA